MQAREQITAGVGQPERDGHGAAGDEFGYALDQLGDSFAGFGGYGNGFREMPAQGEESGRIA